MSVDYTLQKEHAFELRSQVKRRSDRLMNYFLPVYFLLGLLFAIPYETWTIAIGVGGLSLLAWYSAKYFFPNNDFSGYVLSCILAIYMAQFIYQMHGLFEMHFFAFIGSAILITYQNWKLQLPLSIFVIVHHSAFGYLQNAGIEEIYFTRLNDFDLQTFAIHIFTAGIVFFISGLWAFQLRKYTERQVLHTLELGRMHKEALLNEEKNKHAAALENSNRELTAANERLDLARREAERANEAKSIFLATMSHEIRTPMNGVIGMASLLAETSLTSKQRTYIETISTCGESLLNVINDILDFSKIESGNMELEQKSFNVRECIEDVLDIFGEKAGKKGLDLMYRMSPQMPAYVIGDSLRLRQVLTNLVSNSVKFTESGEIFVTAEMAGDAADGKLWLEFRVHDTGIGIPDEKLHKLFKAFSQIDSSTTRKYGGTGLGLVISEKLISLMGGSIRVETKPGKGTVFIFRILSERGEATAFAGQRCKIEDFAGKKVLIIDDNQTNLQILKTQLESWHMIPSLAMNGEQALEMIAKQQSFDIVLTDMQMPQMDGVEVTTEIKKRMPYLPVILLSSVGDEFGKTAPQLFDTVLTKPVRQQMLCSTVMKALKVSATIRNEEEANSEISKFASKYPYSILVAEDNPINQEVINHILVNMGYTPKIVENGIAAFNALRETNYELVLMDMQMPEMDGLECTRKIRKSLTIQPLIIALTANAMPADQEECIRSGMNDYLPKPISLDDLRSKLISWHGQRIPDQELEKFDRN